MGFYFSPKPRRANAAQGWPASPEENLERLKDAGLPMDRGVPKCGRCGGTYGLHAFSSTEANANIEVGHTSRGCPEEPMENVDRVGVKCVNCDADGHRARDCPEPRKDRFACRNCKCVTLDLYSDSSTNLTRQSGHSAAECTEPRSAEGVECKRCNEGQTRPPPQPVRS